MFSLLSQIDIIYLSFKGSLPPFCLLLSDIIFFCLFLQNSDIISTGNAVSDSMSSMQAPKACQMWQQ